MNIEWIW